METTKLSLLEAVDDAVTTAQLDVSVWLDAAAWSQSQELRTAISRAKATTDGLKSEAPRLQAELDQLQEQLKASELVLTLEKIPPLHFDKLVDDNPSFDPMTRWDETTFAPALIAASCVGVSGVYEAEGVTVDEVVGLFERLNSKQHDDIYQAALRVNLEVPKPFMAAATAKTPSSGQSSTTASNGDSLTPGT